MPESLISFYQSRRDQFAESERTSAQEARFYATLRLVTAIAVLGAGWQAIADPQWLWTALVVAGLVLFAFCVRRHVSHRNRQRFFGRLKQINEYEIRAVSYPSAAPPGPDAAASPGPEAVASAGSLYSDGSAYAETSHPYAYDLDIFGKDSLFQLINRTACLSGEELLARILSSPPDSERTIRERQQAIAALTPLVDFRQQFMAKGQSVRETPRETIQLIDWLAAPPAALNTPLLRCLRYLLPAIAVVLLALALFNAVSHSWWVIIVLFNLALSGLFLKRINRYHAVVSGKHLLLEKFSLLLEHMGNQALQTATLQSIGQEGLQAFAIIKRLTKLLALLNQRLNLMVGTVLNGFFLMDFHCIVAIDKWRARHRAQMPRWLEGIFRMDELGSFANFAFNHPGYSFADFHQEPFIKAESLGHPLIAKRACIPNDFGSRPEEKVVILTGANMSGKSTFLRSIGINLVLAYAGAPVFAGRFSCCLAGLYSSMRVNDSLGEDTSYFYAELKRLSMIMEQLRSGRKLFILLDEILKGTNSADKLYGSTGLVEEFIRHECLCIIATHDLELGKLEEKHPLQISNYCFESTIRDRELFFDYKLKKGIARNKNATFLMQKTGLIR